MNCPHCNTPNPPEMLHCISCGAPLMPSVLENIEKKRRRAGIIRAILLAVFLSFMYYSVMYSVSVMWISRFISLAPNNISYDELMMLYTDSFNRDSTYLNIISACICILAVAVFCIFSRRGFFRTVNLRPASPVKTVSAFVCGLTLQIPIGVIVSLIPFSESAMNTHAEVVNAATAPLWVQLFYGVVIAPVIEEMVFRGIAHDRLSKVMPVPLAAALSSVGFALIHGEFISILVAFACGFVLALLYSRFGTVTVPVAFHMGFNLLSFAVYLVNGQIALIIAAAISVVLFVISTVLLLKR